MSFIEQVSQFRSTDGAPLARVAWSQLPPEKRQRAIGIGLALLFEGLLVALLLSLGEARQHEERRADAVVTFDASEHPDDTKPEPASEPKGGRKAAPRPQPVAQPTQQPDRPTPALPTPPKPVPTLIPVSPNAMRQFDLATAAPAKPAAQAGPVGPVDTPRPGDSERIAGSGPHGEPLYAARWYREPTHDELAGYLSTVSGPAWALINCQTAPQYRVENCELVSESPKGAGMGRAVLAATWQFKVRPPQIGGRPQVGQWVRILIEYTIQPGQAVPAG